MKKYLKLLLSKTILIDLMYLTLSSFLSSICFNWIYYHAGFQLEMINGISSLVLTSFSIHKYIVSFLFLLPLLYLSFVLFGKGFSFKTIYVILMNTIMKRFIPTINIMSYLKTNRYVSLLIASIFGGILLGLSIVIALNHDSSTGGSDLTALIAKKLYYKGHISTIIFILDAILLILNSLITRDFILLLFGMISLLLIDFMIHIFLNEEKLLFEHFNC